MRRADQPEMQHVEVVAGDLHLAVYRFGVLWMKQQGMLAWCRCEKRDIVTLNPLDLVAAQLDTCRLEGCKCD